MEAFGTAFDSLDDRVRLSPLTFLLSFAFPVFQLNLLTVWTRDCPCSMAYAIDPLSVVCVVV
eukprot:COSAG01_NODE_17926_length_1113_cov_44.264300_1_plen_62_part_00